MMAVRPEALPAFLKEEARMDDASLKTRFLAVVETPVDRDEVAELVARCAAAGPMVSASDRIDLAAALAHIAFLAPDRTAEIYDALAEGWRGQPVQAKPITGFNQPPVAVPSGLWDACWSLLEDGLAGKLDALSVTQRTAALGRYSDAETVRRVADMSRLYAGVTKAASGAMPELIKLETLAACPPGSLGERFHDLIVDNQFDLEVLDRSEIGLSKLPPPLDYLNTRMLQAHDLWHITAGYETTSLHEIAISAFQMAQFGHNYSAQFLFITSLFGAFSPPEGYSVVMDTISSAWVHGRETPAMILIPWEEVWHLPVDQIRKEFGIKAYKSPHPANLIELSRAAA